MRYLATILLLLAALLLCGLAVTQSGGKYYEVLFGIPPADQGEMLYQSEELNKVRQITLTNSSGAKAEFKFIDNAWYAISPWKDRADSEFIRFLIAFSTQLEIQEVLPRKDLDLETFGLKEGHIEVTMNDDQGENICYFRIGRTSALHINVEENEQTISIPTIFIREMDKKKRDYVYICSNPSAEALSSLFREDFVYLRDHHPFYFTPKLLDEVRIQSSEGEVVLSVDPLSRGWQITKPLTLKVDPDALVTLFKNLAKLTAVKVENRADVTLPAAEENNSVAREISMRFHGSEEANTLKIYPPEPGSPHSLATVSDRPNVVFQLPINEPELVSIGELELGVNDLRSKTLLSIDGKKLSTIIVRPEGKRDIFLKREPNEPWKIGRNESFEAININTLQELIFAATQDKIERFVTDAATDLSLYGLDKPILQIAFIGYNKTGMRLDFGRQPQGDEIYAHIAGSPQIWQISLETLSKIATDPWQWRSSFVWKIPKIDIQKIVLEKGSEPPIELRYEFASEKWQATRDGQDITSAINPNRANTFLDKLESISTETWLGPYNPQASKLLENPNMVIHVHIRPVDYDGNVLPEIVKSIRIASAPNNLLHFAKVSTEPTTPEIATDEANYFLIDPVLVQQLSINLFE